MDEFDMMQEDRISGYNGFEYDYDAQCAEDEDDCRSCRCTDDEEDDEELDWTNCPVPDCDEE